VQLDPIKPTQNRPGTKLLKPKHDQLLSSFAFKFNLHRYTKEGVMFCTYSLLIHGSGKVAALQDAAGGKKAEVDPMDLIKPGSRLKQLVDWLDKVGRCRLTQRNPL
jgi:hypothetical protein